MTMHKLAVYGTLKAAHGNHRVLGDDRVFLGKGKTKENFRMDGYGIPVVYKTAVAPVVVELYEVTEEQLTGPLDRLEGNGSYYNREETDIVLDDTGEEHKAWLYFGMDHYEDDYVEKPEIGYYEWPMHRPKMSDYSAY